MSRQGNNFFESGCEVTNKLDEVTATRKRNLLRLLNSFCRLGLQKCEENDGHRYQPYPEGNGCNTSVEQGGRQVMKIDMFRRDPDQQH